MKRAFDILCSAIGLLVLSPLLIAVAVAIYLQDYRSPFYVAVRVGKGERPFRMVKFRSMIVRADAMGVDSTAGDDPRITGLGRFIRRFKLDETPQLWNVLRGEMSLVGPRPNVERETRLYTSAEIRLLDARPGITDLASIVFADEGEILRGSDDPDLKYNQVIRPWKSRLGLLYVGGKRSVALDLEIIWLTVISAMDRRRALKGVQQLAASLGADSQLLEVVSRTKQLLPAAPPGANEIVSTRAIAV